MSPIKLVLAVLFCWAAAAHAVTLEELGQKKAELDAAEVDAKLAELKNKATPGGLGAMPALPAPGAAGQQVKPVTAEEDPPRLVAVYGLGADLHGEIYYRGAVVPIAVRGNNRVGPWRVKQITGSSVTLVKGRHTRQLYIGANPDNEVGNRAVGGSMGALPVAPGPSMAPMR